MSLVLSTLFKKHKLPFLLATIEHVKDGLHSSSCSCNASGYDGRVFKLANIKIQKSLHFSYPPPRSNLSISLSLPLIIYLTVVVVGPPLIACLLACLISQVSQRVYRNDPFLFDMGIVPAGQKGPDRPGQPNPPPILPANVCIPTASRMLPYATG